MKLIYEPSSLMCGLLLNEGNNGYTIDSYNNTNLVVHDGNQVIQSFTITPEISLLVTRIEPPDFDRRWYRRRWIGDKDVQMRLTTIDGWIFVSFIYYEATKEIRLINVVKSNGRSLNERDNYIVDSMLKSIDDIDNEHLGIRFARQSPYRINLLQKQFYGF